jgi:hypothetical protein
MESRRQRLLVFIFVLVAVTLYWSVRSFLENEESRVRKAVYAGALAVEREDLRRCAALISDSYADPSGNDKPMLLRAASSIFREYRKFRVEIKSLDIRLDDGQAQADIGVQCYFKKPDDERVYYDTGKLSVDFRKEGNRWCVASLAYEGMDELLFLPAVA